MAGQAPIQLGSSAATAWTFESGTAIQTSVSGIQSVTLSALWGDGSTVLSNIPAYGSSISGFTNYLPASFLLDQNEKGPAIEYLEGRIARGTFTFKRQDPARIGSVSRVVSVDTVVNYKSILSPLTTALAATGDRAESKFGFPEPVCTVRYNSSTQPLFSDGIHAVPGSARAVDFPPVPTISIPLSFVIGAGGEATYFNGTTFVSVGVTVATTFNFAMNFVPDPSGWQLIKLKVDPICARSFFDVEEQWRNFYQFENVALTGTIPPLPPP